MNLREQYAALLAELRSLAAKAKDGLTEDEGAAFDAKTTEARAIKTRLDDQERRERDAAEMTAEHDRMTRGRGSVAGIVPGGASGGDRGGTNAQRLEQRIAAASVRQGIADRFLASEGWKEYREGGFAGGRNTGRMEVGSFFHRGGGAALDVTDLGPEELRTVIATGALPTDPAFIAPNRLPGVYTPDLPDSPSARPSSTCKPAAR